MTEGLEVIRLAEGLDADVPLKTVWDVTMLKHRIELEGQRTMAFTLLKTISLFMNGGSYIDAIGHLFTKNEMDEVERKKQEDMQTASDMRRLVMFRNIAKRFD